MKTPKAILLTVVYLVLLIVAAPGISFLKPNLLRTEKSKDTFQEKYGVIAAGVATAMADLRRVQQPLARELGAFQLVFGCGSRGTCTGMVRPPFVAWKSASMVFPCTAPRTLNCDGGRPSSGTAEFDRWRRPWSRSRAPRTALASAGTSSSGRERTFPMPVWSRSSPSGASEAVTDAPITG